MTIPATPSTVPLPPATTASYPTADSSSAVEPTTTGAAATPMRPQASQPLPFLKGCAGLKLNSCCSATSGLYLQGGSRRRAEREWTVKEWE